MESDVSPGPSLSASGSSTSLVGRSTTSLLVALLMETSFLTSTNNAGISKKKKMQQDYTDNNHRSQYVPENHISSFLKGTHLELNCPRSYKSIDIIKINTSKQEQVIGLTWMYSISFLFAHMAD